MREAAKASGLTFEEIGIRMGKPHAIAKQTVQRLLNSKRTPFNPSLETLFDFARAVQKPVTFFFGE
jgi:transcriptional regulator with XRE-family HTH domain